MFGLFLELTYFNDQIRERSEEFKKKLTGKRS